MQKLPFVSICIPVYNGAKYIRETIQSALNQSFSDFEILIIDDQSTDESDAIISEYENIDSRLFFYRNSKRLGLVGNWNECIKRARGKWIKFIFQDDLLAPNCLEKMIGFVLKSESKENVIFCQRKFIFENIDSLDEYERRMQKKKFYWDIYPNKTCITPTDTMKIITRWAGRNIFGEPSSYLIHRKVFDQLGLFDNSFHHICDLEYWLRIGVNSRMLTIPETLVYFRVHGQSTTSFNRREKWLQMRYLEKVRLFRKFMNDFYYAPLREEMAAWPCNMFLKTQTAISARRARVEVEAAEDDKWNDEFNAFCLEYSDIRILANTNYFILVIRYAVSKSCLNIKWFICSLKGWLNNRSPQKKCFFSKIS